MFVLCPHCQFLVALEPATGQPPEQCPRCHDRLQPLSTAALPEPPGELDAGIEATAAASVATSDVPDQVLDKVDIPGAAVLPDISEDAPGIQPEMIGGTSTEEAGVGIVHARDRNVEEAKPAIAHARPPSTRSIRWPSATARRRLAIASVPLLAILLLLQSLLSDRARLAADARWRPLMIVLCDALPCTLPPWREPAAFTLLERDVRPDPDHPDVLHVSAGFRNDARWAQPLPALLLTLSDADGRVAGTRAFRPKEYLAAPVTQNSLASGQSAKVSFDVLAPTRDVVAFTFDFR